MKNIIKITFLIVFCFLSNKIFASDMIDDTKPPQKISNTQLNEIYYDNRTQIGRYEFKALDHDAFKKAMPSILQKGTMYNEGGTIQETQQILNPEQIDYSIPAVILTYTYKTYFGYDYPFSIQRIVPDEVQKAYNSLGLVADEQTNWSMVKHNFDEIFKNASEENKKEIVGFMKIISEFLGKNFIDPKKIPKKTNN